MGILRVKIKPMHRDDVESVVALEAKAYGEHHWSKDSFYNELSNELAKYFSVFNEKD